MDKIVGIVSPFKDYNYGTVLQAFALYKKLEELGVKSEYIDYTATSQLPSWKRTCRYFLHPTQLWRRVFHKQIVNPIVAFLESDLFEANKREYNKFIERIPCSECYDINSIKKADEKYSLFIVGSDQTWSPFLNNDNSLYFLNFTSDNKKNSYAPSLGTSTISDDYKQLIKKKISSFKTVSCREQFGAELLSSLLERNVLNVLDPTLLMDANDWKNYEEPVNEVPSHYILVYQLGKKPDLLNYATKLSHNIGCPIVSLLTNDYTMNWETVIDGVGPAKFLWLIHHADYVITDSFHGTMFSINYQRQFFSFTKVDGNENSFDNIRLLDFFKAFGIEERLIKDVSSVPDSVDYAELSRILNKKRSASVGYLQSIVQDL